jgi:hypothetical protein
MVCLPYILSGLLFGRTALLLSGILSRPWSPLSSLPPDVEVPLPLGLDFIELPVVGAAPGVAELAAGSPVIAPRPLGPPACASATLLETAKVEATANVASFISDPPDDLMKQIDAKRLGSRPDARTMSPLPRAGAFSSKHSDPIFG